jgi:hypothetical protein
MYDFIILFLDFCFVLVDGCQVDFYLFGVPAFLAFGAAAAGFLAFSTFFFSFAIFLSP